ncbi:MAG: hypothetical protein JWN70_3984 [Planctomycetaceae bacterium]|nr:hypothetical protein [Planctomycetaceae bacterium]
MAIIYVFQRAAWMGWLLMAVGNLQAGEPRLSATPTEVRLSTNRSRQQLLVTHDAGDGYQYDLTRDVVFESADRAIADVDQTGIVRPVRQGSTVIRISSRAAMGQPLRAEVPVAVGDLAQSPPVSFTNEVMAVLGKAGCNTGACHGHNSGKGGFKLSLRGYNPGQDLHVLTRDQLGRRVNLLTPEESLILRKPSGLLPHGGDKRFAVGSPFYSLLKQWVVEGGRPDSNQPARLERIEVLPDFRLMPQPGQAQQIVVNAHFANGTIRDVTDQAIFELSAEGVIEVRSDGLVTGKRQGEAAVLVRFLGQMALSRYLVISHQPAFAWNDTPVHNFVDTHVWKKLQAIQVLPSDLCSDSEFLRRATFDTTGLPPDADDVRAFLADPRPDKRARKIDDLLDREAFGDYWALRWLEISGVREAYIRGKMVWTLSFWLRDAINRNMPYDQFVQTLLAGKGSSLENPAVTFTATEIVKVEVIPQLFLGVRLECAQCHDHPFDVWKQSDYQSLQQFFLELANKEGPGDTSGREIRNFIPPEKFLPWEMGKTVGLRLLDGSTVDVPVQRNRREVLGEWLFGAAKKQTARAIANRAWGKLLGRGIIEPVDDMRFSNPPVNAPLLEALADDFIAHGYDFKHLVRTILNSRTYQLSSIPNASNSGEEMNFSHARLRRLSGEQLLDAIVQATGVSEETKVTPLGFRAAQIPTEYTGSRFLSMFGRPNQRMSPCECIRSPEVTLPQILHLLNGDTIGKKLRAEDSTLTRMLAAQPPNSQLVEDLYVAVLSRLPSDRERRLGEAYLKDSENQGQGAEDLMWTLLTSQEFLFNH